jgi:hypothetical protein
MGMLETYRRQALAYVRSKTTYVFPIVGGRNINHLKGNVEALALELTEDEIDEIENAYPFEIGFPMNMLFEWRGTGKYKTSSTSKDIGLLKTAVHLDTVDWPKVSLLVA